jgi:hypothetical protein
MCKKRCKLQCVSKNIVWIENRNLDTANLASGHFSEKDFEN